MKNPEKQRNPSAPSVPPGSNLTLLVLRRTKVRIANILILSVFLTSCATMQINGVSMKKPQKRTADRTETSFFIGGLIVGFATVMHFKEPKKNK